MNENRNSDQQSMKCAQKTMPYETENESEKWKYKTKHWIWNLFRQSTRHNIRHPPPKYRLQPAECQCSSFDCITCSAPRRTSARSGWSSSASSSASGGGPRSSNVSATPPATWPWPPPVSSSARPWVPRTVWTRSRSRYPGEFLED